MSFWDTIDGESFLLGLMVGALLFAVLQHLP